MSVEHDAITGVYSGTKLDTVHVVRVMEASGTPDRLMWGKRLEEEKKHG